MLKSFTDKNMAIIVRNKGEEELFIEHCKRLDIKYVERCEECCTNKYPVAYFIEKYGDKYAVSWLEFLIEEHPIYKSNYSLYLYENLIHKN